MFSSFINVCVLPVPKVWLRVGLEHRRCLADEVRQAVCESNVSGLFAGLCHLIKPGWCRSQVKQLDFAIDIFKCCIESLLVVKWQSSLAIKSPYT
jgi:hypothetical protein